MEWENGTKRNLIQRIIVGSWRFHRRTSFEEHCFDGVIVVCGSETGDVGRRRAQEHQSTSGKPVGPGSQPVQPRIELSDPEELDAHRRCRDQSLDSTWRTAMFEGIREI